MIGPTVHGWGTQIVHDADLPGAPEVATIAPGGVRTGLPDARVRILLALVALTRPAVVPWFQARAVYLAIVESYLGASVRHEVENLLPPIQGAAEPLVALAVIARSTARTWERQVPGIVEPLQRLADKLDPEREAPSCLACGQSEPECGAEMAVTTGEAP